MCRQDLEALAGLDIPDPDSLVESPRDDHIGLRVEIHAEGEVSVTVKSLDEGPRGDVPQPEGLVVGCRH